MEDNTNRKTKKTKNLKLKNNRKARTKEKPTKTLSLKTKIKKQTKQKISDKNKEI